MEDESIALFILGMVFGAVLSGLVVHGTQTSRFERELISRDLGLYCPTDGIFAWKDECDDSTKP